MIGYVKSGSGIASREIAGDRLLNRSRHFGIPLEAGTLNVRVESLPDALEWLGEPDVLVDEPWSTVGTLRAWRVRMTINGHQADAYVTRGESSRAGALETMAGVHWRSLGIKDGDEVLLER